MKKLLAIIVLGLLFSGNAYADYYAIAKHKNYKERFWQSSSQSSEQKAKNIALNMCQTMTVTGGYKDGCYIDKVNFTTAKVKGGVKGGQPVKTFQYKGPETSCHDDIDTSWRYSNDKTSIIWTRKNKTKNSIIITGQGLWAKNNKTVMIKTTKEILVKPFEVKTSQIYLGNLNLDVAGSAFSSCKYGSVVKASSNSNYNKSKSDEGMKWWYWVLLLIALMVLGVIVDGSSKKDVKKKVTSVNKVQVSNQNFWDGNQSLAITFWGYFIGGNAVINVLTLILASSSFAIIIILALVIWNVAAIIGVFKSADIYKAEKIKQGKDYIWANVAKIGSVLLILSAIGNAL